MPRRRRARHRPEQRRRAGSRGRRFLPWGLLAELDCNHIQERMDMQAPMDMQTSGSSTVISTGPDLSRDGVERYWESTAPGAGRRMPRADAVSDAATVDLNGVWRFRLSPTAAGTGSA